MGSWPVTGGVSQAGPTSAGSGGLTSGKREEGRQMFHLNPRAQASGALEAAE